MMTHNGVKQRKSVEHWKESVPRCNEDVDNVVTNRIYLQPYEDSSQEEDEPQAPYSIHFSRRKGLIKRRNSAQSLAQSDQIFVEPTQPVSERKDLTRCSSMKSPNSYSEKTKSQKVKFWLKEKKDKKNAEPSTQTVSLQSPPQTPEITVTSPSPEVPRRGQYWQDRTQRLTQTHFMQSSNDSKAPEDSETNCPENHPDRKDKFAAIRNGFGHNKKRSHKESENSEIQILEDEPKPLTISEKVRQFTEPISDQIKKSVSNLKIVKPQENEEHLELVDEPERKTWRERICPCLPFGKRETETPNHVEGNKSYGAI